jgi:hypothetical protein
MALTEEGNRNSILKSILGRRLGMDKDDVLSGAKGYKVAVTSATSDTTGTALKNSGVNSVVTTTNDTWTLASPIPGVEVKIVTGSSSTGLHTITPTNATIVSSNGSAGSSITLAGPGAYISMIGNTTAQWLVTGIRSTTGGNTYASVSS